MNVARLYISHEILTDSLFPDCDFHIVGITDFTSGGAICLLVAGEDIPKDASLVTVETTQHHSPEHQTQQVIKVN